MIALALLLILFPSFCCDSNEWNGIIPLKSTRADVEKILGKPIRPSTNMARYKTKTENVMVVYAERPCGERLLNRGTSLDALVVLMEVNPTARPKISDFKIEQAKFQKTVDELKDQVIYQNLKDGVTVVEDAANHTVIQFAYTPEKSFADEYCRKIQ